MYKNKVQLYEDQEYVQSQSNINLFNTHKCIKEKKIRKFKHQKNTKNNQITQNLSLLYQLETTTNQQSKVSLSNRQTIFSIKKKDKYNCVNESTNNNFGFLQLNIKNKSLDIRSHFVEMKNSLHKQIFLPLSPIKEIEEYVFYQSKLKQVMINDQIYCQDNLEIIVFKIEKQYKIKIEPGLIEGLILNDKIFKNQFIIYLECQNSNGRIYEVQIEFENQNDYEQFQLF
ncbi:unnamed protein product [Paramecium pentaurelia]|uniref:Uncharacterized protein n=1 Tax=Paramecium pentaurelia TaxID=43138 RepID=A0A8S1T0K5_9CILI|nr:unnamed protein product [Paramecium pentaurelia]